MNLPFCDTIFHIKAGNKIVPLAVVNCGEERIPRKVFEDFTKRKAARRKYIQNIFILVSKSFFFVKYMRNGTRYLMAFNRLTNEVVGIDKLKSNSSIDEYMKFGFVDDLSNGKINFLPKYCTGGKVYDVIYSTDLNNDAILVVGTVK